MNYPIGGTKIDRFGEIEALIEAGMIGARERDHKLAGTLVHLIDGNAIFSQKIRIHNGDEMMQQIGRSFEQLFGVLFHDAFEIFRLVARHAVPSFGLAKM